MIYPTQKIAAVLTTLIALHIGSSAAAPTATPQPTTPTSIAKSANSTAITIAPTSKPASLETQFANISKQSKLQTNRLDELEIANRNALTRNQTLQLENDNLSVQVKVLQSDRGAQMFIYGAVAILVGGLIGYLIASNFLRRTRRW